LSSHRHRGYSRSLFAFPNLLIHPGLSYMAIHGYNPTYFTSSPANRAPECIMTSSRVHPHNLPRYIHRAYRQMKILSPKTQLRRYCTWRCPISPYLPHPSDSTCSIVFASRSRTYKHHATFAESFAERSKMYSPGAPQCGLRISLGTIVPVSRQTLRGDLICPRWGVHDSHTTDGVSPGR
jgi:hypothetical protein